MGKVLWVIVIVVVVIAVYNTFSNLGDKLKFESISALVRFPSAMNKNATATVSYSIGGSGAAVERGLGGSSAVVNPPAPKPAVTPPFGFTADQLSPYYGQVEVGYPSQGNSYDPSQFSVRAGYSIAGPINITGWSVKSNKGTLSFPKAVNDYNPSGLSPNGDIILNKNDFVVFYSNYSPIGTGLRLNKCTGYLNSSVSFNPRLPNNCPSMYERSEISSFSGACQNLMSSLWGCAVPNPDQVNLLPYSDTDCRVLLSNRLNYNGCYSRFHNEADFLSNEWRVWLRTQFNFDWAHDDLRLFDRNGLLVDQYVY